MINFLRQGSKHGTMDMKLCIEFFRFKISVYKKILSIVLCLKPCLNAFLSFILLFLSKMSWRIFYIIPFTFLVDHRQNK